MTKNKVGSDPASIPKESQGGKNASGSATTKPSKEGHGGQKHQQKK